MESSLGGSVCFLGSNLQRWFFKVKNLFEESNAYRCKAKSHAYTLLAYAKPEQKTSEKAWGGAVGFRRNGITHLGLTLTVKSVLAAQLILEEVHHRVDSQQGLTTL